MSDWSEKKRLELIRRLIEGFRLKGLSNDQIEALEKIEFITYASDEFLEANKQNFSDILD